MIKDMKKLTSFQLVKKQVSLFLTFIQLLIILLVFIPPINAQTKLMTISEPNDWTDFINFLPNAKMAGISIRISLLPPSRTPPICPTCNYSEPYRLDFLRWGKEIANLSLRYSNLKEYSIEELQQNVDLGFLTQKYIDSVTSEVKSINPTLNLIKNNTRTYWVATTGNDNNTGTYAKPFTTIKHAYSLANPGDSVIVMPGTYTEIVSGTEVCFWFNRNGTAYQPIVVKSYTKGSAILDGQLNTTNKYVIAISGNYNVVSGFNIKRGGFFGVTVQGNHNTITYCEVDSNGNVSNPSSMGQGGIYEGNGGYRGTYMYNYIHNNGRTPGGGDHGVYIESDSALIAYNIITYNSDAGVNTKGTHTFIYNNTLAHNGHAIGISDQDPVYPNYIVIRNNIFYLDNLEGADSSNISSYGYGQGYAIHDACDYITYGGRTPVVIKNNLFAEKSTNYMFEMKSPHNWGASWYSYGHWDTSGVYEDYNRTLFVSDPTDFRISSNTEIAVDHGYDWQTAWGITQDFLGNTKNGSNWDIGAIEY